MTGRFARRIAMLGAVGLWAAAVQAGAGPFAGTWQNQDPNTGGVTAAEIVESGAGYSLRLWGKCHPTDCDWGTVPATAHYGAVTGAGPELALSAMYDQGFATRDVVVKLLPGDRLEAEVLARYKAGDTRKPTLETATFKRRMVVVAVRPAVRPELVRATVVPAAGAEDCLSFNPQSAEVKQVQGSWKIVDGDHWMLDFAANQAEARQALLIIKTLGLDQHCFVGRPDPSFHYWLAGGAAPKRDAKGEDCVGFGNATAEVKQVQGSWKIVDGDHWMFDFGANQAEARQALAMIKKYGFSKSCFVGRGNPSMQYLKR